MCFQMRKSINLVSHSQIYHTALQNACQFLFIRFNLAQTVLDKSSQNLQMISKINKTVYTNGKSILSLSQMIGIGGNRKYIDPLMNNFYIHEHMNHDTEVGSQKEEKLLQEVIQKQQIVRCLISPNISQKQMHLKINKLKRNPLLNHLIQLHEDQKYKLNTPQIIINSRVDLSEDKIEEQATVKVKESELPVHMAMHGMDLNKEQIIVSKKKVLEAIQNNLNKNILELEKLLVDGLSLDVSYMISNRNLYEDFQRNDKKELLKNVWLECITKKSKSIHSNIIENGINFEETVYDQGYKLHHIFLSSYLEDKQKVSLLEQNESYKLQEIVNILGMIDFNGKIVLDCQKDDSGSQAEFVKNLEFLDKALRKGGFKKKQFDDLGSDTSYISAL